MSSDKKEFLKMVMSEEFFKKLELSLQDPVKTDIPLVKQFQASVRSNRNRYITFPILVNFIYQNEPVEVRAKMTKSPNIISKNLDKRLSNPEEHKSFVYLIEKILNCSDKYYIDLRFLAHQFGISIETLSSCISKSNIIRNHENFTNKRFMVINGYTNFNGKSSIPLVNSNEGLVILDKKKNNIAVVSNLNKKLRKFSDLTNNEIYTIETKYRWLYKLYNEDNKDVLIKINRINKETFIESSTCIDILLNMSFLNGKNYISMISDTKMKSIAERILLSYYDNPFLNDNERYYSLENGVLKDNSQEITKKQMIELSQRLSKSKIASLPSNYHRQAVYGKIDNQNIKDIAVSLFNIFKDETNLTSDDYRNIILSNYKENDGKKDISKNKNKISEVVSFIFNLQVSRQKYIATI